MTLLRWGTLVLAFTMANPVLASGCDAPDTAFMTTICGDPDLRADWRVLMLTLREAKLRAPDDAARHMLSEAFLGWREVLASWVPEAGDAREELERLIRFETHELPELGQSIGEMRTFLGQFSGGPFTGFDGGCGYISSAEWVRSEFFCVGLIRMQNGERLCTVQSEWASGHITSDLYVDRVIDGDVSHRGHCTEASWGFSVCPSEFEDENAHWNTNEPKAETGWPFDGVAGGKLAIGLSSQPNLIAWREVGEDARDWLQTCLTTTDYPPPDQSWPGDGPKHQ